MNILNILKNQKILYLICENIILIGDEDDECNKRVSFFPLEQSLIDRYYGEHANDTFTENMPDAEIHMLQHKAK